MKILKFNFFIKNGETAIYPAVRLGLNTITELLLEKGASLQAPLSVIQFFNTFFFLFILFIVIFKTLEPPLFVAISKNQISTVQLLLKHDPSLITQTNPRGHFPIHLACKLGRHEIVEILFTYKADVNKYNQVRGK